MTKNIVRTGIFSLIVGLTMNVSAFAVAGQESQEQDLLSKVHDYSHTWWVPLIIKTDMTFNVTPDWWPKILEDDGWGIKDISNFGTNINEYYKRLKLTNLEEIESINNNERDANRPAVESKIQELKNKVTFTLNTNGVKCGDTSFDLAHRYMSTISEFLASEQWEPKGNEAHITLNLSSTAKGVTVTINPDGKHFVVTAPANIEVNEWDSQIVKGLKRGGKSSQ